MDESEKRDTIDFVYFLMDHFEIWNVDEGTWVHNKNRRAYDVKSILEFWDSLED